MAVELKVACAVMGVLCVAVIVLSYYTYHGRFEGTVTYSSYEVGNWGTALFETGTNDYFLMIDYKSRGAFVAGRKIHASIEFTANNKVEEFKEAQLAVLFPGASLYPLPEGYDRIQTPRVELRFEADGAKGYGEIEFVYLMPEMSGRSVLTPWAKEGSYTYVLMIGTGDGPGVPQPISSFTRSSADLHVAPLETELQLRNNNLTLILTYIVVYIAIVAAALSWAALRK